MHPIKNSNFAKLKKSIREFLSLIFSKFRQEEKGTKQRDLTSKDTPNMTSASIDAAKSVDAGRDIVVGEGNSINNGKIGCPSVHVKGDVHGVVVNNNFYSRRNIIIALLIPIPFIFQILILRHFLGGGIYPPIELDSNPKPVSASDFQSGSNQTHDKDGADAGIHGPLEPQISDRNLKSVEELIYQIFAGFRVLDVHSNVDTHTDNKANQSAKDGNESSEYTKRYVPITPMQRLLLEFLDIGKNASGENAKVGLFDSGVELPKILEEELPLFPISDFDFEQVVATSTDPFEYPTGEISFDRIDSSDPSGDFTEGINLNHRSDLNSDLDDEIVSIEVLPMTYLDIITSQDRLSETAEDLTEEEMTEILLSELGEHLSDPFPNTDFINFDSGQYAKNGLKPASEPHYLTGFTPMFLVAALKEKRKPKQKS